MIGQFESPLKTQDAASQSGEVSYREESKLLMMRALFMTQRIVEKLAAFSHQRDLVQNRRLLAMLSINDWGELAGQIKQPQAIVQKAKDRLEQWEKEKASAAPEAIEKTPEGWIQIESAPQGQGAVGAVAGAATGIGVSIKSNEPIEQEGAILLLQRPDVLAIAHFDRISGIACKSGSPISHLAICAREAQIPMVVQVPDALFQKLEGRKISLDGATGKIVLTESS
jgi:pyruvate,water dikinase